MGKSKKKTETETVLDEVAMVCDAGERDVWSEPRDDNEISIFTKLMLLLRPRVCGMLTENADCFISQTPCNPTECPLTDEELHQEKKAKGFSKAVESIKALKEIKQTYVDELEQKDIDAIINKDV